ncbi:MAG: hypothetical protein ACREEG_00305, partial [Phenylobacterium sp.]
FFQLTEAEARAVWEDPNPSPIRRLIAARDAATRIKATNYAVFCMPKSGSSFTNHALLHALRLPSVSLTSFGTAGASSHFGMNSREQEIDELALTKAILRAPHGFVAQVHTRYSMYLALQMRTFGLTPIVTIRNLLDCIVSLDDMMMSWRAGLGEQGWVSDPPFALPKTYTELEPTTRLEILGRSFGVWLINFYLSWKRGAAQKVVRPLVIRYEEDILDKDRFVELISGHLQMTPEQKGRLVEYTHNPDRVQSRLNVGVSGRGRQLVPPSVIEGLLDHIRVFRDEITEDEVRYLIQ